MYLKFENNENILIAYLIGELDHHSAEEVRNKIDDRLERDCTNKLIMDFSQVTFMDSSGIGVVIGRYKKLLLKKGSICVCNVRESVKRIFELSGMDKIIHLYPNLKEAIRNI